MRRLIALLVFLPLLCLSEGAQRVWISDKATAGTWKLQDPVCLYQNNQMAGCGIIKEMKTGSFAVDVFDQRNPIQPRVPIKVIRDVRSSTTSESLKDKMQVSNAKTFNLSLGLTAGTKYFYPNAHFQLAFNRNWSLGIMPMFASYSQADDEVSAYGAFVTLTYYYTHFAFKGVQIEGGVGMDSITTKTNDGIRIVEETNKPLCAKFTIGWSGRALWDLGLDIGVAAGAQYLFYEETANTSSFRGLLPLVNAYLAYNF